MIKVADFCAIRKCNAVSQPIESIREDDTSFSSYGYTINFCGGFNLVADAQVDLTLVGMSKRVWFPRGCHECQGYTLRPVKSTIESLEGNKVKLVVEIDEVEFDRNIDDAFRKIAKQVRIPGFRQGKAPRKLLEAQIGLDAARAQALQDSIPEYLAQAVRTHHVDLIATPDVKVTQGEEAGPIAFDATCEVRPEITVPGYEGLRVELPSMSVADSEVDEAVDAERKRHGKLVDVDRAIAKGDNVSLDLTGTRDGAPLPGLNVEDWMYEVGKAWVSPSFDDKLVGAKVGERIEYSEAPNGTTDEALITVIVKKVQELAIDDLTDEWVSSNVAEFDTVDAWKSSIRERLSEIKLSQARSVFVERTTSALAQLVEIEAPEVMVSNDLQARVRNMVEQFQAQGISLDQWLSVTGQSTQGFVDAMREEAVKAVKIDLALRAVAIARGIEATEDDLSTELDRIAMQMGRKVAQVRKAYEQNDAMDDLAAQIRKSKAVDWLLRNSTLVDAEGDSVDAKVLFGDDESTEDDLGNE
jgi:trigger factor